MTGPTAARQINVRNLWVFGFRISGFGTANEDFNAETQRLRVSVERTSRGVRHSERGGEWYERPQCETPIRHVGFESEVLRLPARSTRSAASG